MNLLPSARRLAVVGALLAVSLSAYGGDGKIHRVGKKVPNSYIVMLYKGQPADTIGAELEKRHGGKLQGMMKRAAMFSIHLPNEAAAEAIAHDPRVAEVEEDEVLEAADCWRQLDPTGKQWGLAHSQDMNQTAQFSDLPGPSLNQVQVYIIDTAIDISLCNPVTDLRVQPYLNSKIYSAEPLIGCDAASDPGGSGYAVSIGLSGTHGTAVASILAGNTYGVVPELNSIISVTALDCLGHGSATSFMGAANYVTTTHQGSLPAVANVSIGGNSDALYNLLKALVDDGIFVAVAAGNSQPGSSPVDACTTTSAGRLGGTAGYPGLMIVGATSIYGYQAFYSYFGNCVNVWAPGGDLNYPIATSVGTSLGTSMSAPEVAGAAVLLYSWYPTWRPADIWAQIKYSETTPYGGLTTLHIPISGGCMVYAPPGYNPNPNCPPNCVTQ